MADIELLLEAERRGILPDDKKELLGEARRRGLVPGAQQPMDEAERAQRRGFNKFSMGLLNYPMDAFTAGVNSAVSGNNFGQEWRRQRQRTQQAVSSEERDTTGMAVDMAVDTAAYTGQAVASAPLMVVRTGAELAQGGIQATRAAYSRLFERGATPSAEAIQASAVPTNALTRLQIGRESGRVGAAFGTGEGVGNAPPDASTADVLTRMGEHAAGGYALGRAIPAAINLYGDRISGPIRNFLTQRATRSAERANVVADDFDAAGVPVFPPAMGGNVVQGTATGLQGTIAGSALRRGARTSTDALETRLAEEMGAAGGVRTPNEVGEESQAFLQRNLVNRSLEREAVEAMPPQQLQDISGVGPGPEARAPDPPRRPRIAPEPVEPVTADAYLESLRTSVPPVPPRAPERVPPDIRPVEPPPQTPEVVARQNEISTESAAISSEYNRLLEEGNVLAEQLRAYVVPGPQGNTVRAGGEELYERVAAIDQRMSGLHARYRSLQREHEEFTASSRETLEAAQRAADSQAVALAAQRNTALERAAEQEAASETRRFQNRVVEDARPNAEAEAAARTERMRQETAEKAETATRENQQRSDADYAADFQSRQARAREPIKELPQSPESYPTQFDTAYDAVRRNAPPIQRNFLGSRNEPPTNVAHELESIAVEARGRGQQEGYREGRLFGQDGKNLRPELLEYLRPRVGDEVADAIAYMARHRASGQFTPALQGKQDIRTIVGRAIRNAEESGHDAAILKRIYRAVDQDIEAFTGVTPAGQHYRAQREQIDALYEKFVNDMRDPLRKIFKEANPARAMQLLERTTQAGGNIRELQAFYKVTREKGDVLSTTNGLLSQKLQSEGLEGFLKFYRGVTPEARALMFSGNARGYGEVMDRMARVGGHLERFMKNAPKGEPGLRQIASNPGNIVAGLLSWMSIPAAVTAGLKAEVASRILSSQAFGKWLRAMPVQRGPKSQQWQRHMNRLRDVATTQLGLNQQATQSLMSSVMSVAGAGPAPPRQNSGTPPVGDFWEHDNQGAFITGRFGNYWGDDNVDAYDEGIVADRSELDNPEGGQMRSYDPMEVLGNRARGRRVRGRGRFGITDEEPRIEVPFPDVEQTPGNALMRRRGSRRFVQ